MPPRRPSRPGPGGPHSRKPTRAQQDAQARDRHQTRKPPRPNRPANSGPSRSEGGDGGERLQKILAHAGVGSRRACEELILQGRVAVDGTVIRELGTKVSPSAVIAVDGEKIRQERHVYFAVYKPKGYVSTNADPSGRPRVVDLLPEVPERVYTVGRLDEYSVGLILLTNDGELANRLMHPKYGVEKKYRVVVAGLPTPEILDKLTEGIWLAEGKVRAKRAKIIGRQGEATILEMVLAEGKNREVRRMLARFGHKVMSLTRNSVGPITLQGLRPGEWRPLTHHEVQMLRDVADGRPMPRGASRGPSGPNRAGRPDRAPGPRGGTGPRPERRGGAVPAGPSAEGGDRRPRRGPQFDGPPEGPERRSRRGPQAGPPEVRPDGPRSGGRPVRPPRPPGPRRYGADRPEMEQDAPSGRGRGPRRTGPGGPAPHDGPRQRPNRTRGPEPVAEESGTLPLNPSSRPPRPAGPRSRSDSGPPSRPPRPPGPRSRTDQSGRPEPPSGPSRRPEPPSGPSRRGGRSQGETPRPVEGGEPPRPPRERRPRPQGQAGGPRSRPGGERRILMFDQEIGGPSGPGNSGPGNEGGPGGGGQRPRSRPPGPRRPPKKGLRPSFRRPRGEAQDGPADDAE